MVKEEDKIKCQFKKELGQWEQQTKPAENYMSHNHHTYLLQQVNLADEAGDDFEDDVIIQVLWLIGTGAFHTIIITIVRTDGAGAGLVKHAQVEVLQSFLAQSL